MDWQSRNETSAKNSSPQTEQESPVINVPSHTASRRNKRTIAAICEVKEEILVEGPPHPGYAIAGAFLPIRNSAY
jgi:hypothetical protein